MLLKDGVSGHTFLTHSPSDQPSHIPVIHALYQDSLRTLRSYILLSLSERAHRHLRPQSSFCVIQIKSELGTTTVLVYIKKDQGTQSDKDVASRIKKTVRETWEKRCKLLTAGNPEMQRHWPRPAGKYVSGQKLSTGPTDGPRFQERKGAELPTTFLAVYLRGPFQGQSVETIRLRSGGQ